MKTQLAIFENYSIRHMCGERLESYRVFFLDPAVKPQDDDSKY
jgi:hypothetical protein